MCCLFLGRRKKPINAIPRKSQENARTVPGQSWDNPMTMLWQIILCVFLFIFSFFLALNTGWPRKEPEPETGTVGTLNFSQDQKCKHDHQNLFQEPKLKSEPHLSVKTVQRKPFPKGTIQTKNRNPNRSKPKGNLLRAASAVKAHEVSLDFEHLASGPLQDWSLSGHFSPHRRWISHVESIPK